jgi:hypothetical protein
MNSFGDSCNKRRSFIGEHLGVASAIMPAALLGVVCLAALAMFSAASCSHPEPTPPRNTRPAPTPTDPPTPTATPTTIPTLIPPVTLKEPEDGSCLECGTGVTLRWSSPHVLQAQEYFRLNMQGKGRESFPSYHTQNHFLLGNLSPGEYKWAVDIVRSVAPGEHIALSEESDSHSFEIAPPTLVVDSVSPMSAVRGTSVLMTVTGENLTPSLVITIGDVTLRKTFVSSTTITATIPTILEVGRHPVDVKDATGESLWSASFEVDEPPPEPTRPPPYPPPKLIGLSIAGCSVTFSWEWSGTLLDDDWFAVRVGVDAPHSVAWVKECSYTHSLSNGGDYTAEIAICRGDPAKGDCNQLAVSQQIVFGFGGCGPTDINKKPPPRPH